MKLRLTVRGWAAVRSMVKHDDDMHHALADDFTAHTKERVDVSAPFAAWWYAQQQLQNAVFGPLGGRCKDAPAAAFLALRTVTRGLNAAYSHPAMRGMGMLNWQGFTIPVWPSQEERKLWTPYPQPGTDMKILVPQWRTARSGQQVTGWVASDPADPSEDRVHLLLWRHPGHP